MGLCAFGLCRGIHTCTALLFAPQKQLPTGAGIAPPPWAALPGYIGTQAHYFIYKEETHP